MPELGKKYTCYSCHTKFYDLGKPEPKCPKCGADQRDADEAPVITPSRSRRVVEEPVEEPEFASEAEPVAAGDEEDDGIVAADEREEEPDVEEEEEY
jgi:hypothetical protein